MRGGANLVRQEPGVQGFEVQVTWHRRIGYGRVQVIPPASQLRSEGRVVSQVMAMQSEPPDTLFISTRHNSHFEHTHTHTHTPFTHLSLAPPSHTGTCPSPLTHRHQSLPPPHTTLTYAPPPLLHPPVPEAAVHFHQAEHHGLAHVSAGVVERLQQARHEVMRQARLQLLGRHAAGAAGRGAWDDGCHVA